MKIAIALLPALLLGACATLPPDGPSRMALPGSGKGFDQFRYDDGVCRQFGLQQSGSAKETAKESALTSAAVGTVVGGLLGAAAGGHQGAAVGAGSGLLVGTMQVRPLLPILMKVHSSAMTMPIPSACMPRVTRLQSRPAWRGSNITNLSLAQPRVQR